MANAESSTCRDAFWAEAVSSVRLRIQPFFRQVRVDPELATIVWPNDIDFCPDLLREWVSAGCVPAYQREGT